MAFVPGGDAPGSIRQASVEDRKAAGASFKDMWSWEDVDDAYLEKVVSNYPYLVQFIQTIEAIHGKARQ